MIKIIDTHAHLNTKEFDDDLEQTILRAKQNDVTDMIVIGMDEYHNKKAIEIADEYPNIYATIGVHPGYVDEATVEHIISLISHHKVVAIGECGIDLYWTKDNLELQKQVFIQQIELSIEHNLPLVIHTRNSFDEAYECLLPYKGKARGVFHCFSSHLQDAKKAIDLGFMIGVDGPITYKNAEDIREIVKTIDLSHILVETDSPYLSPTPNRGKRNEPANTKEVVKKIAEIKGITIEEVAQITYQNAQKLFQLGGFSK
ncbi:MAG: TatD family hydrolase [Acholeplasmataceae bacterium]|jgi:TatD DNase family protein|nr:TatD family hydrolase [Acholeplasmataceae bacterium]